MTIPADILQLAQSTVSKISSRMEASPTLGAAATEVIAEALMSDWQTIETAPKDGSTVLTFGCLHDDGGVDMGETPTFKISRWSDCGWYSPCSGTHEPTHWMPLPSPPVSK